MLLTYSLRWKFGKKKLSGKPLNVSIAWAAACGFLMFGYGKFMLSMKCYAATNDMPVDQGVLSALLTLNDFQKSLPLMTPRSRANDLCWLDAPTNTIPDPNNCTGDSNTQAAGVAIYQIGCFLGAVLILFYGEVWGRKSSTFYGSIIMIIGTILQAAAHDYGTLIAGRVIGGIGNGMVTSSKFCLQWVGSFELALTFLQLFPHGNPNARNQRIEDETLSLPVQRSCLVS